MSTQKKRKLDPVPDVQPQVMSAVALRKLRQQQNTANESQSLAGSKQPKKPQSHAQTSPHTRPDTPEQPIASADTPDIDDVSEERELTTHQKVKSSASSISQESRCHKGDSQWSRLIQHSTFSPNETNLRRKGKGRIQLDLPEGERLVILGSYGISVQQGEVTISGATLKPSNKVNWVHAPYSCALPVLRCAEETRILLQPHPAACNIRALEKLSPMFGRLWNELSPAEPDDTFKIIYTSADGPKRAFLQDLVSPAEWNKELASIAKSKDVLSSVTLVSGPKSSGKSTFSRLLVNRLLTDEDQPRSKTRPGVAVLDIDPGQPEFSTPGHLSLMYLTEPNLSPPYCHPLVTHGSGQVIRSHAVAAVSPGTFDAHYTECVLDLFAVFRKELRGKCPLIINTSGWVQGSGLDSLMELISKIRPTRVVYMSQDGPGETVAGLRTAAGTHALVELPSQTTEYTTRTALHLRSMQTMSYFHLDLKDAKSAYLDWDPRPLTSRPPWTVRYAGPKRGIFGLMGYDDDPSVDLPRDAIDGMVMSVVEIEDPRAFSELGVSNRSSDSHMEVDVDSGPHSEVDGYNSIEHSLLTLSPEGLPIIQNAERAKLDPRYSRTIGSVLVRGVNTRTKELELLSPIRLEVFSSVLQHNRKLVLVYGELDPPTWAYAEDMYKKAAESTTDGVNGDAAPELTEEDTDDDASERDEAPEAVPYQNSEAPWVVALHGSQARGVGSKVWRVRRDLGRRGNMD